MWALIVLAGNALLARDECIRASHSRPRDKSRQRPAADEMRVVLHEGHGPPPPEANGRLAKDSLVLVATEVCHGLLRRWNNEGRDVETSMSSPPHR